MVKRKTPDLPTVHVSSLLFIGALVPALLFKGPQMEYFAVTQIMLVIWLGWILMRSRDQVLRVPKTPLTLCLTLFWSWLAVSLIWSLAPGISLINFWWVGSVALVFWLYVLTPDRETLWSHTAAVVLVIGIVLALMGIYQTFVLEEPARSIFETRNSQAAFLNIVTLPASAYFLLLMTDKSFPRHYPLLLGTALCVLFFSIFLTASRGAMLSLVLSMSVLVVLVLHHTTRRGIGALLLLMLAAFLFTKISHGELSERLPHLAQDSSRRVIWESSWHLLQVSPWRGIGLGLFFLAYPAFRNPADSSGGYFAHNDYLQIWIETGLPGLLLLLSVLFAVLWLFVRALKVTGRRGHARIEMTGLFCGLLAVAGHSIVDFNLYILSIMMTAGLAMGRLHELVGRELNLSSWRIHFSRVSSMRVYPVIVFLLLLLPVAYFLSLGLTNSYYETALAQAREGKLQEADKSLGAAQILVPSDDRTLIAHADLYRYAATLLPSEAEGSKKPLYENALKLLDRAQRANPLRGLTFVVRGRLYQQNPALAGDGWYEYAVDSFRRALSLDPRLLQGRLDYADLLLQQGKRDEALGLLEEGLRYEYSYMPELIPFYSLTAKLRRETGREDDAKRLEDKARDLEKQVAGSYSPRGY